MEVFDFKQFSIRHDRSAHKVGTDGVLLGAWTNVGGANQILDVGCGSGLISIMIAQRADLGAFVTGIDKDRDSILDAEYNRRHCPWSENLCFREMDVANFRPEVEPDLILCNPPFFQNSLKAPKDRRNVARHSIWPWEKWVNIFDALSCNQTKWSLILPINEKKAFEAAVKTHDWRISRIQEVGPSATKSANRVLIELSRQWVQPICLPRLNLYCTNCSQERSEGYAQLTKDYYL